MPRSSSHLNFSAKTGSAVRIPRKLALVDAVGPNKCEDIEDYKADDLETEKCFGVGLILAAGRALRKNRVKLLFRFDERDAALDFLAGVRDEHDVIELDLVFFLGFLVIEAVFVMTGRKFFADVFRQVKQKSVGVGAEAAVDVSDGLVRDVIDINRRFLRYFTPIVKIA